MYMVLEAKAKAESLRVLLRSDTSNYLHDEIILRYAPGRLQANHKESKMLMLLN